MKLTKKTIQLICDLERQIGEGLKKLFPEGVNTEFVQIIDENTVKFRVWERGSGETLACGTGATATAVACILNGLTDNVVTVKLLGGDLTIEWKGTSPDSQECAFMTGAATTVFTGEIDI